MTPIDVVALFDRWGLSSAEAAQLLGYTHASVCRWRRMAAGTEPGGHAPLNDPFWCHILTALDPEQHGANLRNILRLSGRATAYLYLLTAHGELHPAAQLRHPAPTGP